MATKTRMKQVDINRLYSILHRIDKAATDARLRYTISAGTALGAIRHGGLIPWDDDGDIYVLEPDWYTASIAFFRALNTQGLHIAPHNIKGRPSDTWLKIYDAGNVFPNVDVFLLTWKPSEMCWKLSDPRAAELWPKECLTPDEVRGIHRVSFGPLHLPIFGTPEKYFARTYGEDWNRTVYEGWDHEKERPAEKKERPITTEDRKPALPDITFD